LPLYALVERNPRPGNPNYVDVACAIDDGVTGELLCLSPIDALIEQQNFNRDGRRYEILPYESVEPRSFIREHGGLLTLYILHSYAAHNNKLLLNKHGHPSAMLCIEQHQFDPEDIEDHYHLKISKETTGWLAKLHRAAGLPDFLSLAYEQAHASISELDIQVSTALRVAEYLDAPDQEPTQCAIFDPVECKWRFVDHDSI
jgi:hypothetical protein